MGSEARYLLLLFSIVMLGDTGGYFAGRLWGKTPLAPRLSPKKTREGLAGSLVMSWAGACAMNAAFQGSSATTGGSRLLVLSSEQAGWLVTY